MFTSVHISYRIDLSVINIIFTTGNERAIIVIIIIVCLKVPLTTKIFLAQVNFCYCHDNYGRKNFGPVFFLQMSYAFRGRKLGAFLPHGWQYLRMGLVYIVMSSHCFIHTQNKHKQKEIVFFLYRMPGLCVVCWFSNEHDPENGIPLYIIPFFLKIFDWSVWKTTHQSGIL